jgi:hypothetical protein
MNIILSESFLLNLKNSINCENIKINNIFYSISIHLKEFRDNNYFTLRGKVVSFHPNYIEQKITDSGKWAREGRKDMKFSNFLTTYCNCYFYQKNDNEFIKLEESSESKVLFDKIINKYTENVLNYQKAIECDFNFETSLNISDIYEIATHPDAGNLTNSCMRPESSCDCVSYSKLNEFIEG